MKRTGIVLDKKIYEALRAKAFRERISMSEIVRRALEKELKKAKNGQN